ncbi:putative uncharacterized protein [Clostridium sp. CAG:242]|nr:putative uncharacterized protein [Clostridium sp. CAG:242]
MLTQVPDISLVASQSGAVNSGLLTSTDTNCLTILNIAYRVGLGIFKSNEGNEQVDLCVFWQFFVLGNDIVEQLFVDLQVVSSLFKGNTEYIFVFDFLWNIGRIDLDYIVAAFTFLLEDCQSFFGITWSDDAVGNFTFDDSCSAFITNIGQCDKVTVGGHSVCASCSCISACNWRKLTQIVYKVDFLHGVIKRQTNCCACWGNVFEGSCCRKSGCFFEFFYQLPAVECVQEVNIAWFTVENLDWKFASIFHKDSGRFLIWVTSIF